MEKVVEVNRATEKDEIQRIVQAQRRSRNRFGAIPQTAILRLSAFDGSSVNDLGSPTRSTRKRKFVS